MKSLKDYDAMIMNLPKILRRNCPYLNIYKNSLLYGCPVSVLCGRKKKYRVVELMEHYFENFAIRDFNRKNVRL